jgi:RNA polymerase sigma factor (sigma-70 family)
MRDYPPITELVTRARRGDKQAWDEIVERYAPLIWSICRQYRLGDADAEDVGQMVWLHLVDHLDDLRDPAALPGWLVTTTRRQCFRVRQAAARLPRLTGPLMDVDNMADTEAVLADQELILAERHAALREAMSDLPPGCRELMALLTADPPVPYAEISARLGIRIGSIGPSRSRCLARMRRHPAIAGLIDADAGPIQCEDASLAPTLST